jgi:hypothetical protein
MFNVSVARRHFDLGRISLDVAAEEYDVVDEMMDKQVYFV